MKVLHLGKFCPPYEGGIEVFSYDLLEYINSKGIKADLLCFGDKSYEGNFKGFNFFSCKTNIILSSAPISIDFVRIFKKIVKDYDILHVQSPNPLAEMITMFIPKPKKLAHPGLWCRG